MDAVAAAAFPKLLFYLRRALSLAYCIFKFMMGNYHVNRVVFYFNLVKQQLYGL